MLVTLKLDSAAVELSVVGWRVEPRCEHHSLPKSQVSGQEDSLTCARPQVVVGWLTRQVQEGMVGVLQSGLAVGTFIIWLLAERGHPIRTCREVPST